jgi:hypothetical protein
MINTNENTKFFHATRFGATAAEIVEEIGEHYIDVMEAVNHALTNHKLHISEWTLSKEGYTWIPTYTWGRGVNVKCPDMKDYQPKRDWSVRLFFGDGNVAPVDHLTPCYTF